MSSRLAAYAVCVEQERVLLVRCVSPAGETNWSLPGGKVEHAEDPFDAVVREVAEETGCDAVVERLRRSSLVDVGIALTRTRPLTGHVPPVLPGGLIQH
ncbi:NUDIX domain-containing protein [Micromonospora lutea]|uniref:Nudix hydrolase domain-containing protein n=1 Tax=Micromonospora lutea TaxID=419825 RepID=A0ABQ4IYQ5_9ACTN|nr:NUDIX domain-containing protein [Micromonospora lutea]GIJ23029.1 hypothetical protein Vlu01_36530 [Micromonospora lutea]